MKKIKIVLLCLATCFGAYILGYLALFHILGKNCVIKYEAYYFNGDKVLVLHSYRYSTFGDRWGRLSDLIEAVYLWQIRSEAIWNATPAMPDEVAHCNSMRKQFPLITRGIVSVNYSQISESSLTCLWMVNKVASASDPPLNPK